VDPNFAGTLHRFLMRYVVRSFASSLMECEGSPRIVPAGNERAFREEVLSCKVGHTECLIPISDFEWRVDGLLTLSELPYALRGKIDIDTLAANLQDSAKQGKLNSARRGVLSMSDALYWAMKCLEDQNIAKIVASRFDEIIVDEVQDTSDIQQRCLFLLCNAGLRSIVYVGDMQQAIYGFAHADPEVLVELIKVTATQTLELSENWRSSQALCNVAHHFSGRSAPDTAVGPNKDDGLPPEIFFYDEGAPTQALDLFGRRLDSLGIEHHAAIVLCRWNATTERLRGEPEVTLGRGLRTLVVAAEAARSDGALERGIIRDVENLVLSFVEPEIDLDEMSTDDHLKLRIRVMQLLDELPKFDVKCKEWTKVARDAMTSLLGDMYSSASSPGYKIRTPSGAGELSMLDVFGTANAVPRIRTIHSAKGQSHAATLLIAVDSSIMSPNWSSWLGEGEPEEVRVAYVALTRAQRYSALALPNSCPKDVVEEYLSRGFIEAAN